MRSATASCVVCGSPLAPVSRRRLPSHVPLASQCVPCLGRQVRGGIGLAFRLPGRPAGLERMDLTRPAAGALAEAGQSAAGLVEQHIALCGENKAATLHDLGLGGGLVCVVRHVIDGRPAVALLMTPPRATAGPGSTAGTGG